jgi:hypothetical protein
MSKSKKIDAIQLERLKELEQMLWEELQANKENDIHDIRLSKLYSDTAFKILRHEAIYKKDADKQPSKCVLDEFVNY